jgi:hypothetical protein
MKPKSEAGKGDANRISNLKQFEDNYDKINFCHNYKIFYANQSYNSYDWFVDEGYYIRNKKDLVIGPFNTWISAKRHGND